MLEFFCGGDHFFHGQLVGDRGHARAWAHHFLHCAAVEADDLQDDVPLGLRERALLEREFEQLLIIGFRESGLRLDGFKNCAAKNRGIHFLRDDSQRRGDFSDDQQQFSDAQ